MSRSEAITRRGLLGAAALTATMTPTSGVDSDDGMFPTKNTVVEEGEKTGERKLIATPSNSSRTTAAPVAALTLQRKDAVGEDAPT